MYKKLSIPHYLCLVVFYSILLSACNTSQVTQDNSLKKIFDDNNVEGCFSLTNNTSGEHTVYNLQLDTTRFSPASTFKIVNSLIGLQTGAINSDSMVINWDGVKRGRGWDTAMNMIEAFKASNVPYYQEVARRIGKPTMQKWVDTLGYGNKNISGAIDSFWLNGILKISPDQQSGLVKRLFFKQLPFSQHAQETVINAMKQVDNTAYKLSYKTGWGFDNGKPIGWVVGWIEENKHVYFFVTFIKSKDDKADIAAIRMNVTNTILKQYGFFEGKK